MNNYELTTCAIHNYTGTATTCPLCLQDAQNNYWERRCEAAEKTIYEREAIMTEKPILFFDPMVRAILSGEKTMTRRVVKHISALGRPEQWCHKLNAHNLERIIGDYRRYCPYGQPGDRLWVREGFVVHTGMVGRYMADGACFHFDPSYKPNYKRPYVRSIHMPRWASRITLEITAVRVERLQDITEIEATHEGIEKHLGIHARDDFSKLWDKINGKRPGCSWTDNPYVWCMSFKRI